jgi:YspA, cpYpsA-related SLOG family
MRRVLICGDRNWKSYARVLACVRKANATEKIDVIVEGECRGADKMGRRAGEEIGLTVENGGILPFPAEWDKYGLAAGPIRNQQQLDEGKPTECWAFHNHFESSVGTKDMVDRALKAGINTYVITEKSWVLRAVNRPIMFDFSADEVQVNGK